MRRGVRQSGLISISIASGLVIALGVINLALTVTDWLSAISAAVLFAVGLTAFALGLGIRRVLTSATLRFTALCAAWSSLALLTLAAVFSGYIDTRRAAYMTAMRVDLRQLVAAQDRFRIDSGRFSATVPPGFRSSAGVGPPRIALTSDGWTGTVTHAMPAPACVIFVGRTPLAPAVDERHPACPPGPFLLRDLQAGSFLMVAGVLLGMCGRVLERRTRHHA